MIRRIVLLIPVFVAGIIIYRHKNIVVVTCVIMFSLLFAIPWLKAIFGPDESKSIGTTKQEVKHVSDIDTKTEEGLD